MHTFKELFLLVAVPGLLICSSECWVRVIREGEGMGRFEGATGSGTNDDYNSDLDPYSHHHWTGTITLVKGPLSAARKNQ